MVILSFSVKEAELQAGTKVRTTRRYSPDKYALWKRTLPGGDLALHGWWKPRTSDGYLLFQRHGRDLYRLKFGRAFGDLYPLIEDMPFSGRFRPMSPEEARRYVAEEGFAGDGLELFEFFRMHYRDVHDIIFQSIAFPEV